MSFTVSVFLARISLSLYAAPSASSFPYAKKSRAAFVNA